MFVLAMNQMQGRAETYTEVARAETREALVAFHERLRVDPYTDNRWHKAFRKGSPLEWFNPLTPSELEGMGTNHFGHGIFDAGTEEEHVQRAGQQARVRFRAAMRDIPDADEWIFREDGVPF